MNKAIALSGYPKKAYIDPKIVTSRPQKTKALTRFDTAQKPNLDLFAGKITFTFIIIYILLYGLLQSHGFISGSFHWYYATILLPVWLIDGFKSFFEVFIRGHYKKSTEDLNKVCVVIACKDGEAVIGQTLASLLKRFNPRQIVVVSNGSTDRTCDIARASGVVTLEVKEPLGKVRAINHALGYVISPYVLLLDDDTLIGDATLPTGLLDEGYGGVAFRVLVKTSSWITKFQAYEYRKSTDIGKRFHNRKASVQNISGAIGLFTLSELRRQIKIHNAEFSGEDLQRTLLIYLSKSSKGVVLSDSTVYTIPPTTVVGLFKQRVFGWFPGLYASFPNYIRILLSRSAPTPLRVDAFYNTFLVMILDIFRLLSLPIIVFYPWYFAVMYVSYLLLETVSYFRSGREEPFYVLLFYPLYGLFGFITRVCAFSVLLYRRLTVFIVGALYFDDYRQARNVIKAVSALSIVVVVAICLLANDRYGYANAFINYNFSRPDTQTAALTK